MRVVAHTIIAAIAMWAAVSGAEPTPASNPYQVVINLENWIEQLHTDDLFEAEPAIEGLAALGDHAIPALMAALKNEPKQSRVHVVEILRDIRTPATFPALALAAGDDDSEVRGDAIEALGKLADRRGAAIVEAALHDGDSSVARYAAIACRSLCRSATAIDKLVGVALRPQPVSQADHARKTLADLARSEVTREAVQDSTRRLALPLLDTVGPRRRLAALLASETMVASPLAILIACANDESLSQHAPACAQSLGKSGAHEAIAPLAKLAQSKKPLLKFAACSGLAQLAAQHEEARPALSACAKEPRPASR